MSQKIKSVDPLSPATPQAINSYLFFDEYFYFPTEKLIKMINLLYNKLNKNTNQTAFRRALKTRLRL